MPSRSSFFFFSHFPWTPIPPCRAEACSAFFLAGRLLHEPLLSPLFTFPQHQARTLRRISKQRATLDQAFLFRRAFLIVRKLYARPFFPFSCRLRPLFQFVFSESNPAPPRSALALTISLSDAVGNLPLELQAWRTTPPPPHFPGGG